MKKAMLTIFLLALAASACGQGASPGVTAANAANPGQELDLQQYLQKGQINIVDFYSAYCPPCRQFAPRLEKLDQQRADLVVVKIDINRTGVKGIDWLSPLARQFSLESIPHFKIFDASGKLLSEGSQAYQQVESWLQAAGLGGRP